MKVLFLIEALNVGSAMLSEIARKRVLTVCFLAISKRFFDDASPLVRRRHRESGTRSVPRPPGQNDRHESPVGARQSSDALGHLD